MLPSAAVENEISGARLVPAIVQVSLPRATTTSAAMRSAAAFAASAVAVATVGANGTTGTVHRDRRRRAERRELLVERGQQGRLVHRATVLRRGERERPVLPADTDASTGVWSIVVARVSTAAASLSRS